MLPKVAERNVGESSFDALIRYISEAEKTLPPTGGEPHIAFSAAVLARSPETAAIEMKALAMQARSDADPVYHFVLAWETETCPSWPEMMAAGWMILDLMDLGAHLCVLAAHHNTQHVHLHCSVCLIHPLSLRPASIWQDWPRLHHACRVVELEFGWPQDRGCYESVEIEGQSVIVPTVRVDSMSKPSRGAVQAETWSGNSFQKSIRRLTGAVAHVLQHEGAGWSELHDLLAMNGVGLRPCDGGGLLISLAARDDPRHQAKASLLGKAASWPALIRKLGEFESSTAASGAAIDFRQPHDPALEPLWRLWALERGNARLNKAMAPYRRAVPLPVETSFRIWLDARAKTGDSASVRALTRLSALATSLDEGEINLPNVRPARPGIDGTMPRLVTITGCGYQRHHDGSIEYRLPRHLGFIDHGDRLVIYDVSEPTLTQALDVARIKWPSGIETFGEPSFIRRAAQIALSAGICVNNSPMSDDPALGARLSESERRFAINMIDLTEILPRYGFVPDNDAAPESGLPFSLRTADGSLTTIFVQRNTVGIWHWVQWSFDAPFGLRNASGNAAHFLIHFGFAHNMADAMKQLDEEITLLQADAIRQSMAMRRDEVRHDHTSARQQWTSADPYELRGYLKEMGITETTKGWAGDVCRCDDLGYAVFQRRDERGHSTGYERYHHIRQDRLSVGGSRNGIIAMGDTQSPERIVIFDNAVSALQSAQAEQLPAATLYVSTGGDGESKALRHMLACHPSALIQVVDSPWLSTRLEDAGHSIERIPDTTMEPHVPGPMAATVEVAFAHAMASDEAEITTERIEFIGVLDDALIHPQPNSGDNQINDPCQEDARSDLNETLLDPDDYPAP